MLQNSQFFTMHQRSLCWKPLTNRGAEQLFTICYRNWDIDWFLPISTSESIWSCFQSLSLISLWNKHLVTEAKMRLSQFMLKIPSVFSWFYKSRQRKKKKKKWSSNAPGREGVKAVQELNHLFLNWKIFLFLSWWWPADVPSHYPSWDPMVS